jgi:hypothetical protein
MNEICSAVKNRMKDIDPMLAGLLPTEYDWMTEEERAEMHTLRLSLPSYGEEALAARERIKARRAQRLQNFN